MVVGAIELFPVPDALGFVEYGAAYPEVADETWEPYRELYPQLFAQASWHVPCNCFLVRSSGTTILVDTGVGPPGQWDWTAEHEGRLPESLKALDVPREDVDAVFLTHLHVDHVGWTTDLEGVPFLPRARYVVHGEALAYALATNGRPHVQRCIVPLADRFEHIAGEAELAPGVVAFSAPGHYPGHMALRLTSEGKEAVLLGDVAVHPAMLDRPELTYVADLDPQVCVATRRALLPDLVDRDVVVACGHYPGTGVGRVRTSDGRVVWREA